MNPKLRWTLVYSLITIMTPFLITFPIAFQLRFLGKFNPLWFVLDDSRKNPDGSLAEDYRIFLRDSKSKLLGVLKWHMSRNKIYNFVNLFPVPNGDPETGNQNIVVTKFISDSLEDGNGNKIPQDGPWVAGAGLKYVGQAGDDPWQVNRGDVQSRQHSIIGDGEIEYSVGSWKGWRKTYCKQVKPWWLFGAKRWRTVFKGTNGSRYSFKYKHQKVKPWGDWPQN